MRIVVVMIVMALCGLWISPNPAAGNPSISEKPLIVVGGALNYPPYEFLDKNGKPTGYNVELTRAVADVMGMNVRIDLEASNSIFRSLDEGRVHILMGIAYTHARAKRFEFSAPHTIVVFSLFGRKDGPPISSMEAWQNRDVMALKNAVINQLAIEKGWTGSLTFVESDEEMLRLLASGKHDYAILATKTGVHLIRDLGLGNIARIAETPEVFKYCFAGKKGNREIVDQFDRGLEILYKTGRYKKIRDKWLGDDLNPHSISWVQVVKFGSLIASLLFAALGVAIVWSHTLKKQVAQRTAALALEVGERQRAEEELLRNQEQLVQSSKMAAIGTLVSGVAHEINNPNGLILLNMKMLQEIYEGIGKITEEKYEKEGDFDLGKWRYSDLRGNLAPMMAETIEASRRIARIVDDLKNFSRRDDHDLNEDVDLNAVAMTAIRLVRNIIRKATDSFVARYGEGLPRVRGNAQRIEQVIVNLILNACQALPDRTKGVTLTTSWDADRRMVVLEVADEGIGIAAEQMQYITDPFYTTKREQGGTGLGLSVSMIIIKEHGGLINFASSQGKGTTVTLSLPALTDGGS